MGSALHALVTQVVPTKDSHQLAEYLRTIVSDLEKTAKLLDGSATDFAGFVNETRYNNNNNNNQHNLSYDGA